MYISVQEVRERERERERVCVCVRCPRSHILPARDLGFDSMPREAGVEYIFGFVNTSRGEENELVRGGLKFIRIGSGGVNCDLRIMVRKRYERMATRCLSPKVQLPDNGIREG